jgi:hypothetical protein
MTILSSEVDKLDAVDKAYHPLYTAKDGKFVLTGVIGYTPEDREKTAGVFAKERKAASDAVNALKPYRAAFGDRKIEEIVADLDRIPELELQTKGKPAEEEIQTRAEARALRLAKPLETKLAAAVAANTAALARITAYERAEEQSAVRAAIQAEAAKSGADPASYAPGGGLLAVLQGVLEVEVEVATDGARKLGAVRSKDGAGFPAGLDTAALIKQVQSTQGYFWAPSKGSGAEHRKGSGNGVNPWMPATKNRTDQMRIINENPELAKQYQAAAGV